MDDQDYHVAPHDRDELAAGQNPAVAVLISLTMWTGMLILLVDWAAG
jgi:hypothetical protein